jgi:hypothetical protein
LPYEARAHIAARPSRAPTLEDSNRAKAMYAAGEGVDHVVASKWLLIWGKPDQKQFAAWLREQHG